MGAKWYFVWSADMGFGLAALAAFLKRAVGRTMAYGGAMECSVCQSSVELVAAISRQQITAAPSQPPLSGTTGDITFT